MTLEEQIKKAKRIIGKRVFYEGAEFIPKKWAALFSIKEAEKEGYASWCVRQEIEKHGFCVAMESQIESIPVEPLTEEKRFETKSGLEIEMFDSHIYVAGGKVNYEEIKRMYDHVFPLLR